MVPLCTGSDGQVVLSSRMKRGRKNTGKSDFKVWAAAKNFRLYMNKQKKYESATTRLQFTAGRLKAITDDYFELSSLTATRKLREQEVSEIGIVKFVTPASDFLSTSNVVAAAAARSDFTFPGFWREKHMGNM